MEKDIFVKSVFINGYKASFDNIQVSLSVPNGRDGSGLNVIVGPNGTGKSHFLEALCWVLLSSSGDRKNVMKSFDGSIEVDFSNNLKAYGKSLSDGRTLSFMNPTEQRELFRFYSSEGARFGLTPLDHTEKQEPLNQYPDIVRTTPVSRFGNFLVKSLRDKTRNKIFHHYLHKFFPGVQLINTLEIGDLVDYRLNDLSNTPLNDLGRGFAAICLFSLYLTEFEIEKPSVLIIDEPELFLHPQMQKKIYEEIRKLSKDKQCIVTTHSPYFINWNDLKMGGRFIRFNTLKAKVDVSWIDSSKEYVARLETLSKIWKRPHILDTVAKEVVFSTKLLLVEGQEDLGLIKAFSQEEGIELNFSIFGYGADGAGNIVKFMDFAQDLGIRVAALFDKGTPDYEICRKKYPNTLLIELPTEDIRDKSVTGKLGVFSEEGKIKCEFKDAFVEILKKITDHFSS